nr:Tn3 family transposase [Burkholderia sp. BCC1993]
MHIGLFSHFISCGMHEAVHILDGLIKNASEAQPDTIYIETYAQSAPVFVLAHLLGTDLTLRISDERDQPFRDRDRRFRQRDRSFRERDRADRKAGLALRMTSTTRAMLAGFGRRQHARAPLPARRCGRYWIGARAKYG